ncbi:MAG: DUF1153 domain-containing protein [Pseudomonadota bacterium]
MKRWTVKGKAELIRHVYKGWTTISDADSEYDLTSSEIEGCV